MLLSSNDSCAMPLTYLSSAESVVTVSLENFSLWDSSSEHIEYHTMLIDAVLAAHPTFSVEVDARFFSLMHLGAVPTFCKLADLCRSRYHGRLGSVTIYQAPTLLRIVAQQLRSHIGTRTWDKIAFK